MCVTATGKVMERKAYPSDLTDEQWTRLESLIPSALPGGRPRKTDLREVVNALRYLTAEGCAWRDLPREFPPWKTVYNYFQGWTRDGTWQRILDALGQQGGPSPAPPPAPVPDSAGDPPVEPVTDREEEGMDRPGRSRDASTASS
jgi:putative transposase